MQGRGHSEHARRCVRPRSCPTPLRTCNWRSLVEVLTIRQPKRATDRARMSRCRASCRRVASADVAGLKIAGTPESALVPGADEPDWPSSELPADEEKRRRSEKPSAGSPPLPLEPLALGGERGLHALLVLRLDARQRHGRPPRRPRAARGVASKQGKRLIARRVGSAAQSIAKGHVGGLGEGGDAEREGELVHLAPLLARHAAPRDVSAPGEPAPLQKPRVPYPGQQQLLVRRRAGEGLAEPPVLGVSFVEPLGQPDAVVLERGQDEQLRPVVGDDRPPHPVRETRPVGSQQCGALPSVGSPRVEDRGEEGAVAHRACEPDEHLPRRCPPHLSEPGVAHQPVVLQCNCGIVSALLPGTGKHLARQLPALLRVPIDLLGRRAHVQRPARRRWVQHNRHRAHRRRGGRVAGGFGSRLAHAALPPRLTQCAYVRRSHPRRLS
eukprot:scaffold16214_cov109-Isochrysis_galbana.AAC.7